MISVSTATRLFLSCESSESKTASEIASAILSGCPSVTDSDVKSAENRVKKTVLIVEDNSELRNYLKNELKEDYKLKMAINGKEGLQMAIKFIPDLVISDVMMPIMDGFEMCSSIKKDIFYKMSFLKILFSRKP